MINLFLREHVSAAIKREFIEEAKRVLKKEGVFICSTPNRDVSDPGKKISDKPYNIFHRREYSKKEFCDLLGEFFNEVEIYGGNYNNLTKVKIFNFLGKFLPFDGVVRINQILKVLKFPFDSMKKHLIKKINNKNDQFEFLIAVCKK